LVLPEPCLFNSRYLKYGVFEKMMRTCGLPVLPGGWKRTPKLFFALCRRTDIKAPPAAAGAVAGGGAVVDRGLPTRKAARSFPKKMLRDGGGMNNFCIQLLNADGESTGGNDRGSKRDGDSRSGGGGNGRGGGGSGGGGGTDRGKAAASAANKKKRKKKSKQDAASK